MIDAFSYPNVYLFQRNNIIRRVHAICADGIYLLCCDDHGIAELVKLSDLKKLSPIVDKRFVPRVESSGKLVAIDNRVGSCTTYGVVEGPADTSYNLRAVATKLGFNFDLLMSVDIATSVPAGKQEVTGNVLHINNRAKRASSKEEKVEPVKEVKKEPEPVKAVEEIVSIDFDMPDFGEINI